MKDIKRSPYPRVLFDMDKLYHNVKVVVDDCSRTGVQVSGIIKGFNGCVDASREFLRAGCTQLGSSRMEQIIENKEAGIDAEFLLVRIPMLSEAEEVAAYADLSLQSELEVMKAVNEACSRLGRRHGVILMAEMGDLREGYWDKEEMIRDAVYVEKELEFFDLKGIGTNLGCYGSIKPTPDKMNELIEIAERIEARIGRQLEIISGGATSNYPMVLEGIMPSRINHLRIGEGIINAFDLDELWNLDMSNMHQDVFTFQAEVIEVKDKPTHPVGEIFIDGFGRKPSYEDRGIRRRMLLATGKLDYAVLDKIVPRLKGIEMVGASSDHAIFDIEDCEREIHVGDIIEFNLCYPALMYLTNSRYVKVVIVKDGKPIRLIRNVREEISL